MVIITLDNGKIGLGIRGAVGIPNALGRFKLGWSRLGYKNDFNAVYQKKTTLKGYAISKMAHYRPTNNRMPYQQFWRDYWATANKIYHSLTSDMLAQYKERSKKLRMTKYNYFMSQYTYEKPAHMGNYRLGWTGLGVLTFIQ